MLTFNSPVFKHKSISELHLTSPIKCKLNDHSGTLLEKDTWQKPPNCRKDWVKLNEGESVHWPLASRGIFTPEL